MRKRLCLGWLILCFVLLFPSTASASLFTQSTSPSARLRAAIDNLVTPFAMNINDPKFDLDKFTESFDFSGVTEWSYSGTQSPTYITLNWTFEWKDEHAVLAAYKNSVLEKRLNKQQKALLQKCRDILKTYVNGESSTGKKKTDYEKVLAIHDYLVLNCVFDEKTAQKRLVDVVTPFTAYGALINGAAVCQGYTEAASLLLTMAGIENYQLYSDTHSWNLLKLGDHYYHMDVTWDDPTPDKPGEVSYVYFNLTDQQMTRYAQHDWQDRSLFPKANAMEFNYFNYNDLYVTTESAMRQKVTEAFNKGDESIMLMLSPNLADKLDDEESLSFIFRLKNNKGTVKGFYYILPDDSHDTLTIWFNY